MLPDGKQISPTHEAKLALPTGSFSDDSLQAYVFPQIQKPLLSIGKLCDDNKIALFTKTKCIILNDITVLPRIQHLVELNTCLQGPRDPITKLWNININNSKEEKPQPSQANSVYHCTKLADIIDYHHLTMFSPVTSTWTTAINAGNFKTWPGLTAKRVQQYLRPSIATSKGHIKQIKQNIRSTKSQMSNLVYTKEYELSKLICSDQTGRFPVTSNRGNKYVMVVLDYDSNAIISQPIPSRSQTHLLQAFTTIHNKLKQAGRNPTFVRLDNEAPNNMKQYMTQQNLHFQLVPPHNHRRNYAEKAIGTWKDHFIAGLTSMEKAFPMYLWCRLTQHADITLNLLRNSRIHPHLSSQEDLFGPFDYNRTPLLPPGVKVVVHEKPQQRGSWAPRGIDGWYLGPSLEHYRCHRVYCPSTRGERTTDTLHIIPHYQNNPTMTAQEAAILATDSLTKAITSKTSAKNFGDAQILALQQLAQALNKTANLPSAPVQLISGSPPSMRPTSNAPPSFPPPQPRVHMTPQPRVSQAQQEATPTHTYNLLPRRHRQNLTITQQSLCNAIYNTTTGKKYTYRHLKQKNPTVWNPSMANEIGRLAQGYKDVKGTNTITFIPKSLLPHDATVTYARIVPDYRPLKAEPYRTRLTVGGDKLPYFNETKTDTASLPTIKTHLNSTISTKGARYATADISNFYLANNKLLYPEYMRINLRDLPEEIIIQYNLKQLADKHEYVYTRIDKGMYGLKGKIAYDNLVKHLQKFGYAPCRITKGLWKHKKTP